MSDTEVEVKPFAVERAKQGRASCKKCKSQCEAGELRIARVNPNNPFGSGPMKSWYHVDCFFQLKQAKNSKTLQRSDEVEGWDLLSDEDKDLIKKKAGGGFQVTLATPASNKQEIIETKDNDFREFQKVVKEISKEPSYNSKSGILRRFLKEGTNKKFKGDTELWIRLLLPKDVDKRIYNLQDKQLVKLFSTIFKLSLPDMTHDVMNGDVSKTIAKFYEKSKIRQPAEESVLTLHEVDEFLNELQDLTHESDQISHFEKFCKKCTANDLRTVIRLIKRDLKMNCGARHVLDAIHPEAYASFQKSRDLKLILKQFKTEAGESSKKTSTGGIQLMTPVSPMLAEACKDFDKALKKCPDGFFSEIKYDGERVQIHKKGNDFKFFSRNLKPVLDHKVSKIKSYLPKAFPHGNDLIIDSEILMVDTETDELLPFGTLGKHKKEGLETAEVCLFIFDCLYFNGEDLTRRTIKERRKFLEDNVTVIKHHIQLSEYQFLRSKNDLVEMTKMVLKKGLEGLVLKGTNTIYEPGKRRWLKVKKDYLLKGAIADTADLVVLGAWYGTGKMGGQYSIFLMGCFDEKAQVWKTVTKVHSGLNDQEMEKIHRKISPLMEKCDSDSRLPKWININRSMIPTALALDPSKMPVFEITGAEFTQSDIHTAGSISIRFPRITKIRNDKSPSQATNLEELKHLYEESKSGANLDELNKLKSGESSNFDEKKTTTTPKKTQKSEEASKIEEKTPKKRKSEEQSNLPEKKLKSTPQKNNEAESPEKLKTPKEAFKRKQDDTETESVKKVKTSHSIFQDFVLFCDDEKMLDEHRKKFKEFENLGGKLTKESRKANLAIHASKEVETSLEKLRACFTPTCRHVQVGWLLESVKEMKLKSFLHFTVSLHQV